MPHGCWSIPGNIATLDLDPGALADGSKTPLELRQALERLGTTKVIHHLDQVIGVGGSASSVDSSSLLPVVNSISNPRAEIVVVSLSQVQVGISGKVTAAGWLENEGGQVLDMALQLRLRGSRPIEIQVTAANPHFDIHECSFSYDGPLGVDRPAVLINAVGDMRGGDQCFVYVLRLVASNIK